MRLPLVLVRAPLAAVFLVACTPPPVAPPAVAEPPVVVVASAAAAPVAPVVAAPPEPASLLALVDAPCRISATKRPLEGARLLWKGERFATFDETLIKQARKLGVQPPVSAP